VEREPDQVEVSQFHESAVEVLKPVVTRAVEFLVVVNHHAQVVLWNVEVDEAQACENLPYSTQMTGQHVCSLISISRPAIVVTDLLIWVWFIPNKSGSGNVHITLNVLKVNLPKLVGRKHF
jgi:hypothetical protein